MRKSRLQDNIAVSNILNAAFGKSNPINILLFIGLFLLNVLNEVVSYYVGLMPAKYYASLPKKNLTVFIQLTVYALTLVIVKSLMLSIVGFMTKFFEIQIRRSLTLYAHRLYFKEKAILFNSWRSEKLDNIDQRFTKNIGEFSEQFALIFVALILAPFLIGFYAYLTYDRSGWLGPVSALGFFVVFSLAIRLLIRYVSKSVYYLEQCEGHFRFKHIKLKENAEEICFAQSNALERFKVKSLFDSVISAQLIVILKQSLLGFITNLSDYIGSILTYFCVGFALFGSGIYSDLDPMKIPEIISATSFFLIYLVNKMTSILDLAVKATDLMAVGVRINELFVEMSNWSTADSTAANQTNTFVDDDDDEGGDNKEEFREENRAGDRAASDQHDNENVKLENGVTMKTLSKSVCRGKRRYRICNIGRRRATKPARQRDGKRLGGSGEGGQIEEREIRGMHGGTINSSYHRSAQRVLSFSAESETAGLLLKLNAVSLWIPFPPFSCIVSNLDLQVMQHQSILLSGASGIGKTSFFRYISGVWKIPPQKEEGGGESASVNSIEWNRNLLMAENYATTEVAQLLENDTINDDHDNYDEEREICQSGAPRVLSPGQRSPLSVVWFSQTPSFTNGTLLEQICYPLKIDQSDEFLRQNSTQEFSIDFLMRYFNLMHLLDAAASPASPASLSHSQYDCVSHDNWQRVLSPGEQQRLCLVRLCFHWPLLAFLDEPTSQISAAEQSSTFALLRRMHITYLTIGHSEKLLDFHDWHLEFFRVNRSIEQRDQEGDLEEHMQTANWKLTKFQRQERQLEAEEKNEEIEVLENV